MAAGAWLAVLALAGAVLYVILHPSVKIPSRKPEPAGEDPSERWRRGDDLYEL